MTGRQGFLLQLGLHQDLLKSHLLFLDLHQGNLLKGIDKKPLEERVYYLVFMDLSKEFFLMFSLQTKCKVVNVYLHIFFQKKISKWKPYLQGQHCL